ncbi:WD40 repeat-like protein, partial [Nadsonia fulvescens var. elongata DSM 6958]
PILVPVSLKRYGLSEVVNHILELEKAIPFDFLITNPISAADSTGETTLLRPGASLDTYLTENGLSSELTLKLEYTRSVLPPQFLASFNHPDWISSVDINGFAKSLGGIDTFTPAIASGSYDGVVRLWSASGTLQSQLVGHSGAVKDVKWSSKNTLVSGSSDRSLLLWRLRQKNITTKEADEEAEADEEELSASVTPYALLTGHTAPINSISVNKASSKIISASDDNTVQVWSTNYKDLPLATGSTGAAGFSTATQKRRRVAASTLNSSIAPSHKRTSLLTLSSHSSPVTAVDFHHQDSSVAYSVSQDHTIKTWDLTTGMNVDTRTTSFALLSLCTLPKLGLLACGSSARHVTLHDPRVDTQTTTQAQLVGHTNFVVSLAASPISDYLFISGSHDGTSRIWDVRATKALHVITREATENNDVYGVDWKNLAGIVSAGKDKKLQIN